MRNTVHPSDIWLKGCTHARIIPDLSPHAWMQCVVDAQDLGFQGQYSSILPCAVEYRTSPVPQMMVPMTTMMAFRTSVFREEGGNPPVAGGGERCRTGKCGNGRSGDGWMIDMGKNNVTQNYK
jgi:hypothetical protein